MKLLVLILGGFLISCTHQGNVSFSFYPDKNEFDHAGNSEPYTARYDIEVEEVISYKKAFISLEGDFYFGNVIPQQGGEGNDSYRFTPLVGDIKGSLGYNILDNLSLSIESGRTLDLGEYYSGDVYKFNKIKTSVRW